MRSTMRCAACDASVGPEDPSPFRCPSARPGDGMDHVLVRVLEAGAVSFPSADDREPNPFLRYRGLMRSSHLAEHFGLADADYLGIAGRIDEAVAAVDGRGFAVTPFARADTLSTRMGFSDRGGLWVKDETGNVSGSHKARHMMGLLVHLEVAERIGLLDSADRPPLAIASCGNAALAAAVMARAGGRELRVFVPTDADPVVVARLKELEADVVVCPRDPGVSGDPTVRALHEAVAEGALPFTCQGNENGLAIEGGITLGYELASAERAGFDHVVTQVGGGALTSAVAQGLREARELGALGRMPRIHTVQTRGAFPLARAYERVAERAAWEGLDDAMRYARTHRGEFMWPWEEAPRSIAHGILDDETYDWAAVVEAMLRTGGTAQVVAEDRLEDANAMAFDATGIPADYTGTSGLAGLMELRRGGGIGDDERVAVLFTGVRRT